MSTRIVVHCNYVCTMQSLPNEKSVSSTYISNSLNLGDPTSTVIMEGYVRGPELEPWYALLHEKGGSLMHKEVPLRRFAALPYLSMWKNKAWTLHCHWLSPGEQAAGRFVPDAASESTVASVGQGALISTVGLYAFTMCECVSVLFDVRQYTVSPRCSTPHQGYVLRNLLPCHPHLHASFLHPPLSEGPSVSAHIFYPGSLQVLKKSEAKRSALTFTHK